MSPHERKRFNLLHCCEKNEFFILRTTICSDPSAGKVSQELFAPLVNVFCTRMNTIGSRWGRDRQSPVTDESRDLSFVRECGGGIALIAPDLPSSSMKSLRSHTSKPLRRAAKKRKRSTPLNHAPRTRAQFRRRSIPLCFDLNSRLATAT